MLCLIDCLYMPEDADVWDIIQAVADMSKVNIIDLMCKAEHMSGGDGVAMVGINNACKVQDLKKGTLEIMYCSTVAHNTFYT